MAKVVVNVVKSFILTREDKSRVHYPVGTHSMPEEDAAHWYTKHHLAKPESAKELPKIESPFSPSGSDDSGDGSNQNDTPGGKGKK